jgi:hypothetical protein
MYCPFIAGNQITAKLHNNHLSLSLSVHNKEHDIVYHDTNANHVFRQAHNGDGVPPINGIPSIP